MNPTFPIHDVTSPEVLASLASGLRRVALDEPPPIGDVLDLLDATARALPRSAAARVDGAIFLGYWLRRTTLEPLLERELGPEYLRGDWAVGPSSRLKAFPLGVLGHWPAGNVAVGPLLSLTCGLLGGNTGLVRVPGRLAGPMAALLAVLAETDRDDILARRVRFVAFPHDRHNLHAAIAAHVDGALVWGGREAVQAVRALPFPPWARLSVFGPRVSAAAMDRDAWRDPVARSAWCARLARDVWQFDQEACSSPQALFVEAEPTDDLEPLAEAIAVAFAEESRRHPPRAADGQMASTVARARAAWLLDAAHRASFPAGPDWTVLVGRGVDLPSPTHGRTLTVLGVSDLAEPVGRFDGQVQTLGLGVAGADEERLADLAGRRGVDRVVPLGRMHIFDSPWDGMELVAPLTRRVRHVPRRTE